MRDAWWRYDPCELWQHLAGWQHLVRNLAGWQRLVRSVRLRPSAIRARQWWTEMRHGRRNNITEYDSE